MAKRLRDSITSQYIEAANRLNSQKARRRIVAYVESYDDVFFWRSILAQFENGERYFEVMLPSRLEHLERGKFEKLRKKFGSKMPKRNMFVK